MLEDAAGIRRVVIACGFVDLRKGIDGLSMIIGDRYHQNPFVFFASTNYLKMQRHFPKVAAGNSSKLHKLPGAC